MIAVRAPYDPSAKACNREQYEEEKPEEMIDHHKLTRGRNPIGQEGNERKHQCTNSKAAWNEAVFVRANQDDDNRQDCEHGGPLPPSNSPQRLCMKPPNLASYSTWLVD